MSISTIDTMREVAAVQIENMTLENVEQVLDWAAQEGWNPGYDDASAFYQTDPNGFIGASKDGRLVAAISVVKYDSHNGFLGLYICHPDFRGKGVGLSVWNAGMGYLKGMNVGLDGVVAQQSNYQQSGFRYAYRNIRYQGLLTSAARTSNVKNVQCREMTASDRPAVHKLDMLIHGIDRQSFIDHWLTDTEYRKSMVCIQQGVVVGVGTIRQCREGFKVGPLMADSFEVANLLIASLSNLFADAAENIEIVLDVPEPNKSAVRLAEQAGLRPVFETARMYKGDMPMYQLDTLYGVSTFELG